MLMFTVRSFSRESESVYPNFFTLPELAGIQIYEYDPAVEHTSWEALEAVAFQGTPAFQQGSDPILMRTARVAY